MKILESSSGSGYSYKGYYVVYSKDRDWTVIEPYDHSVVSSGISSDLDAEDFIDEILEEKRSRIDNLIGESELDKDTAYQLPVGRTTLKTLGTKYKDYEGPGYVLRSEFGTQYATIDGIGKISSPGLEIYKNPEVARKDRLYRHSNFGIVEVDIKNGEIVRVYSL